MEFINDLVARLEQKHICLNGCSKAQLSELIAKAGNLPKAYIEFLLVMQETPVRFLDGEDPLEKG